MKTLIFIHGGESFKTHEEYERFLYDVYIDWQSEPWSPPEEKIVWRDVIAKKWYTQGNQVFMPVFPNKLNARYDEWKIVFEGIVSKLSRADEVTFVGVSLGGCFLLKYFSEMKNQDLPFVIPRNEESLSNSGIESLGTSFAKVQEKGMYPQGVYCLPTAGQKRIQIHQIHLIAACLECGNFSSPSNYEVLQKLGNQVHIWHAEDDMIVPFATAQELANHLPQAETHFFSSEKGYGHFHGVERIPELEFAIFGE